MRKGTTDTTAALREHVGMVKDSDEGKQHRGQGCQGLGEGNSDINYAQGKSR